MKSERKPFKNNLVVIYHGNVENFRIPVRELIGHLAWLHGIDYWIEDAKTIFGELNEDGDLFYFRSGENTRISSKEFRELTLKMFNQSVFGLALDVMFQLQSALKQYPFPHEFYRPLNWPYLEIHNRGKSTLMVYGKVIDSLEVS